MAKEIGIDFGTTNTVVSYVNKLGYVRPLKLKGSEFITPTVLYFKSRNELLIGEVAKKKGASHPEAAVANFKSDLSDPTKKYYIKAENGDQFILKPERAVQIFLNQLIDKVQPKLIREFGKEGTIGKAVVTVPAQFDPKEKDIIKYAIKEAGKAAGFSDIRLAAEPTAAAVAYQEENAEDGETILVYDFGGGTFDVSIIKKKDGIFSEVATDGDKKLGGNTLTMKLAKELWEICLEEFGKEYPFDEESFDEEEYELSMENYQRNKNAIIQEANGIKEELSEDDEVERGVNFYIDSGDTPCMTELYYSREQLNALISEDIQKTIDLTERVLNQVETEESELKIDQIVLAGGSSQIPLIQEKLSENPKFRDAVGTGEGAATLISRGAALLSTQELRIEEKTRFEIGTAVAKGLEFDHFQPIISVGEELPCDGTQRFYLSRSGQTELDIPYYERDIKNYPNARRLDDEGINEVDILHVSGIPKIDGIKIDVTFRIGADGTPSVEAQVRDEQDQILKTEGLKIEKGGNLE